MPRISSIEFVRHRVSFICVLIVACGMLAACGSEKKHDPNAASAVVSTATIVPSPTALSGPPRIGPVVWATSVDLQSKAPNIPATPVVDDRVIYAVVPIESLPAGSQLVASWYFNDTSLDALGSAIRIDRDRVSGWLEFHIERTGADPWPDGVYEIVITDGSNELQRSQVAIS